MNDDYQEMRDKQTDLTPHRQKTSTENKPV